LRRAGDFNIAGGARRAPVLFAAMLAIFFVAPVHVAAAPEEVQVYTDDVNEPGEFGLEMHINYTVDGFRTPSYAGNLPSHHVLQVTPEFSYGFAKHWDAGLYLLSAVAPDGNAYGNGVKLRVKYVAPASGAWFWGLNMEVGRTSRRLTESNTNIELRPIIGWRSDKWLLSFNPIIGVALSGDAGHEPSLAPAIKVARTVGEGVQIGFEHYADLGGIHHIPAFNQQDHVFYGVVDIATKKGYDFNFGIGRGVTGASEKWVAKMIIGIPFK
jgi:hypothetical protein